MFKLRKGAKQPQYNSSFMNKKKFPTHGVGNKKQIY